MLLIGVEGVDRGFEFRCCFFFTFAFASVEFNLELNDVELKTLFWVLFINSLLLRLMLDGESASGEVGEVAMNDEEFEL